MKKGQIVFNIITLLLIVAIISLLGFGYYKKYTYQIKHPIVTIQIEKYGEVKIELYPEMAPNTVKNFISLIKSKYYDGLKFHRVEKDWLVQAGQKDLAEGEKEYSIKGEFVANGYIENTLKFERGTVGLARKDYSYYQSIDPNLVEEGYNSGYGEFFVMLTDEPEFDSYYAPFGKVLKGLDILDKISKLETTKETDSSTNEITNTSTPINQPVITKMTVNTFGVNYKGAEKQEAFDINSTLMNYYYNMQQ